MTRERKILVTNVAITIGITAVLWIVWILDVTLHLDMPQYGIIPHTAVGLRGILLSAFIHDNRDIWHLVSNTLPFAALFFVLLSAYRQLALVVLITIHLMSGFLVWMYAPGYTIHIGISGIIYGIAAFLVGSGIFRRDIVSLSIAVLISLMYGGMAAGLFRQPGISWQSHLFGALVGLGLAFILRHYHPRPLLDIEKEEPEDERHFFERYP